MITVRAEDATTTISSSTSRVSFTAVQLSQLQKVGLHGYTHGWHFVGTPDDGGAKPVFYHGTAKRFAPGDLISPHSQVPEAERSGRYDESSPDHVYLTRDPGRAAEYAGMRDDPGPESSRDDRYGVYQVEPTGPFERDPQHTGDEEGYGKEPNYRSQHPLRVVRRVPYSHEQIRDAEVEPWDEDDPRLGQEISHPLLKPAEGQELSGGAAHSAATQLSSLPTEERKAVERYKDSGYIDVNRSLRSGDEPSGDARLISSAMQRQRLSSPITVHRNLKQRGLEADLGPGWRTADLTGHEWADNGFASAASSADFWPARPHLVLHVPAGISAISVDQHGGDSEDEILLDRGLHYRVARDHVVDGQRVLDVNVSKPAPQAESPRFYHVAWDDDRDSIRENGLRTGAGQGGKPGHVWLYTDLSAARNDSAGSDIWEVRNPPNVIPGHIASPEWSPGDKVAASDAVPPESLSLAESLDPEAMPYRPARTEKSASDLHDASPVDAEHVYQQLLANYPPASIAWVRKIPWIGPVSVPLGRVDWDDVKSWAASHQKKRVKQFRKRIRASDADVNPVVGVQVPGDDRLKVIDGHHRALAYRKEGLPVKAYAGFAPSDKPDDPWFQAHDYQYHDGKSPLNKNFNPLEARGPRGEWVGLEAHDYEGAVGDRSHITRTESGLIPTRDIDMLLGASGEFPGGHRNRHGAEWQAFKKDIAENGIKSPVFITVDHGGDPVISEGNHRRDAAVELGMPHVPVSIRYFGHAERQGTVHDRAHVAKGHSAGLASVKYDTIRPVPEVSLDEWLPVFGSYTASGKVKVQLASLVKVGPEGYIHGYICVRPPCGDYEEAVHETRTGKVAHDGQLIGRQLKKDDGDAGYSVAHVSADGKERLSAQFATRADAAKGVALYHNISALRDHAAKSSQPAAAKALDDAGKSLSSGDYEGAAAHLGAAEKAAGQHGDTALATHAADTREAVSSAPKPVSAPAKPAGEPALEQSPRVAGSELFTWHDGELKYDVEAQQRGDLTGEERGAARAWATGEDSQRIQRHLRAGDASDPEVALLDSAIGKSPLEHGTELHHSIPPSYSGISGWKPGSVISDRGYRAASKTSQSVETPSGSSAAGWHHVTITVPAGSHALYVSHSPYDEVLLPRDGRLRVDSVADRPGGSGLKDIHATLLGDSEPEQAAGSDVIKPEEPKPEPELSADEVTQRLRSDPSYVPSDDEHKKLKDAQLKAFMAWDKLPYGSEKTKTQLSMNRLNDAITESTSRRALAEQSAAAEAARGVKLDTSELSGTLDDHLSAEDAAEIHGLINDGSISYPDPKGEPWVNGEYSPGAWKARRLDTLKYTAAQSMMEKAGVPHDAAEAIAGWPGAPDIMDHYMSNSDSEDDDDYDYFMSMERRVGNWASTGGSNAARVSTDYDKSRAMTSAPETRPGDFARHKVTKTNQYGSAPAWTSTSWTFDDQSPGAVQRRADAALYWGIRAQQYYTSQVLASLPKKQLDSIPVTRMIHGAQAQALREAVRRGEDWAVSTRSLSSWAEPSHRAKSSIKRYVVSSVGGVEPMWLDQQVSPSQVFAHWRGEGELRNGVKVLGEVITADSDTSSADATASEVT